MREDIVRIAKDILYEVQTQEIDFSNVRGICAIVSNRLIEKYGDIEEDTYDDILASTLIKWEHFSGFIEYPVPSTNENYDARQAYNHFKLWEGEQLKLRIDLLKHIIKELEK